MKEENHDSQASIQNGKDEVQAKSLSVFSHGSNDERSEAQSSS